MNNTVFSSIEEIKAAIQSHNPFINTSIVKEQDVFGKKFLDVPSLNAHASNAVFQAIDLVKNNQQKLTTILITAQMGAGKTHIIHRIGHQIRQRDNALFIYASGNKYTDLDIITYQFQQTVVDSLCHIGKQDVTKWQEIATAMANEALKSINPNSNIITPKNLVARFDSIYTNGLANNKNLMELLVQQIIKSKPKVDVYIIRAILWTLSQTYAPCAIKWLAGDDIAQSHIDAMGLPNTIRNMKDREAEALKNIQQMLSLISLYNTVVICFDEGENKDCNENGLTTPQIIADLVKRLHDTPQLSDLGRGIVITTVMFPDTLKFQIQKFGGVIDRISTYTNSKPIELKFLDSNTMVDLVSIRMRDFYESKNLNPENPLYPFTEDELRNYGKNRPTPREALRWCAEKINDPIKPPSELFKIALANQSTIEYENYLDDNELISKALCFAFETLVGEILEGETSTGQKLNKLKINSIEVDIKPKAKNNNWINFKILGEEQGKSFTIGVAVLQHTRMTSVNGGLQRLIDYETFGLTRGCLVRSANRKINKNCLAYSKLQTLVENQNGEQVDLKEEEIKPLIDLYYVYQDCTLHNLKGEQVKEFAKDIIIKHPLLLEILSDPSGVINANSIEEDTGDLFALLKNNSSNSQTISLDDDNSIQKDIDEFFKINNL
ncbi:ATP-binding protein [Sphaerospermopsis aphanizomenoides BCCUSP55]|uniref:P-loop NTPase fold protein n=1 Tax=Sphaerospermopsis aphanizomenoides TaxID=459663 RepID=UPI001907535D|nr:P-loop NTPase fold protein [Sphaerospermopsis aphanizomenoides]MBK1987625.1 ATP-binding protein [Sphaerospermopsis aphanizomenoides BCCUSP55]